MCRTLERLVEVSNIRRDDIQRYPQLPSSVIKNNADAVRIRKPSILGYALDSGNETGFDAVGDGVC